MSKFKNHLKLKRKELGMTSRELAGRSCVSPSLLSGLEKGNRVVGEKQAKRIAAALNLENQEHSDFVFMAMNESRDRLMDLSEDYPVETLNFLPMLLRKMGISPEMISESRIFDRFLEISLSTGEVFRVYFDFRMF
jgi:transcriptional regulator with XRE-family HTH domain